MKLFQYSNWLVKMYSARVEQLGTCLRCRVNSTYLKNRILAHFPDLQAHKEVRNILLVFNEDVGPAMRKACEHDADAIHLARAANIVRREIFNQKSCFTGSFDSQCQPSSVPNSLMALVSMILYGPNIKTQSSYLSTPQDIVTVADVQQLCTSPRWWLLLSQAQTRKRDTPSTVCRSVDPQQNSQEGTSGCPV